MLFSRENSKPSNTQSETLHGSLYSDVISIDFLGVKFQTRIASRFISSLERRKNYARDEGSLLSEANKGLKTEVPLH